MSQSHNVEPQWRTAFFARTSFATTSGYRRTSLRHDQAMDEPGRLSHARPRQGPRRVQLDGARLQSTTGAQHSRRRKADGGRGQMNDAHICTKSGAKAARGAPGDVRDAIRGPDNKNPSKHARRTS